MRALIRILDTAFWWALAVAAVLWLVPKANAHDHWINNPAYKSESGAHCCGVTGPNADCVEIPDDSAKPRADGQGYDTPKGRIGNRSIYTSEDGKTWLCAPRNGPPRCLFIRIGG